MVYRFKKKNHDSRRIIIIIYYRYAFYFINQLRGLYVVPKFRMCGATKNYQVIMIFFCGAAAQLGPWLPPHS